MFFQEVKSILLKGQLPVGGHDAGKTGALMAQVEFGDSNDQMCYPRYFKEMESRHFKRYLQEPCFPERYF